MVTLRRTIYQRCRAGAGSAGQDVGVDGVDGGGVLMTGSRTRAASAADGGGEDAAELDRYPVGPGVQFGGDVERELQAG